MRPVRACTSRFLSLRLPSGTRRDIVIFFILRRSPARLPSRSGRDIDILFIFRCNRSRLPNMLGRDTVWSDRLVLGILTPCSKRKCQCPEEQDPIAPQFHEPEISDTISIGASRSTTRRTLTYDFTPRSIRSTSYPSGASMKEILLLPLECGPSDNG